MDDFIDYVKERFVPIIWVGIATALTVVVLVAGRYALIMYMQDQGMERTGFYISASSNLGNAQTFYAPTLDNLEINDDSINETVLDDENAEIKPAVVYNTTGVKISVIGIYNNEDTGNSDVAVYIENYNTFGVSVESSSVEVNGCKLKNGFNKYIKSGSAKLQYIEVSKEFLTVNGLDAIDNIKLALDIVKVYDTGYEPIGNTGEVLVKFC